MKKILLLLMVCIALETRAQNLVVNPGFEQPLSTGWTIVSGSWEQTGAGYGYGDPNTGDYYATPRFISSGKEMYQDVDVSTYAASIDNGTRSFLFNAYLQVASNGDSAKTVVEYRNTAGDVLATDEVFETISNFNVWNLKSASRIAPANTRTIRIRLLAIPPFGFGDLIMFDDISLTTTATLPLRLLYFKAIPARENVLLEWETADELNTAAFEIQSSNNGALFTTVYTTLAQGNNGHRYTASLPLNGATFFRLKMIDRNGNFTYSPVDKINGNGKLLFTLYPNPATNKLIISAAGLQENATINMYNARGRLVLPVILLKGERMVVDVSALPNGLYQAQCIATGSKTIQTLLIAH